MCHEVKIEGEDTGSTLISEALIGQNLICPICFSLSFPQTSTSRQAKKAYRTLHIGHLKEIISLALNAKRTDIHKILIIGSGPIVIGQPASLIIPVLRHARLAAEGYEIVLVNSIQQRS